jgi:putative transposase
MTVVARSFRIRAYPNAAQQRLLDRWFGAHRWLWNTALAIRSAAYREFGWSFTGNDISRWLTQWKRTAGHEWLAAVPATCLTQCLRDQDAAFRNFFAKRARYPRYKRKGLAGSLRFQGVGAGWRHGVLRLPKLGALKLAEALPAVEKPDMATLSRDGTGPYFVSFCAEVAVEPLPLTNRVVGVDLGLTAFATLSTGEKVENPKRYRRRLRYLRRQQRILARRRKGSRRRERQKAVVAKAHAKVRAQRHDALHRLTTRLVREHDVICIEDLNVRGMARGRNAQALHDVAFGEFRRQLEYKCGWYGRTLVAVDRWYASSKSCSGCRYRLEELRLDQRRWRCPKCGAEHDRDENAAINILAEGLRQIGGREDRDSAWSGEGPCTGAVRAQVLDREARSRQLTGAWKEHARVS